MAGRGVLYALEDARGEHVRPGDAQVGWGILRPGLLDQVLDVVQAVLQPDRVQHPIVLYLLPRHPFRGYDRPSGAGMDLHQLLDHRDLGDMDGVPQHDRERHIADVVPCLVHRVPEAALLMLAYVMQVREVVQPAYAAQQRLAVAVPEDGLQLQGAVEVVLDGPLVPPGDDDYVPYPGLDRLFHHVLDDRLVYDREHLLGLFLGQREEPHSPSSRRNDRLHGYQHIPS